MQVLATMMLNSFKLSPCVKQVRCQILRWDGPLCQCQACGLCTILYVLYPVYFVRIYRADWLRV